MVRVEQLQSEYPLHWLVWNNEYKALELELAKKEVIYSNVAIVTYLFRNRSPEKTYIDVCVNSYKCRVSISLICPNLQHDKEKRDCRGRTPLMLAITLGHVESARVLLHFEANVSCENSDGWTGKQFISISNGTTLFIYLLLLAVQEAVATGDPELLQLVLERRDFQRYSSRMAGIPQLLQRLKEAPDFYVEMKWEFTSWGVNFSI